MFKVSTIYAPATMTQSRTIKQPQPEYSQVLDLIVALVENPYFVGIEQLDMKFNQKDRKEMDLVLVVSTFVK